MKCGFEAFFHNLLNSLSHCGPANTCGGMGASASRGGAAWLRLVAGLRLLAAEGLQSLAHPRWHYRRGAADARGVAADSRGGTAASHGGGTASLKAAGQLLLRSVQKCEVTN